MITGPEMLTAREVADYFGVDVQTVYRWIKAGQVDAVRLPGSKTIRIPVKAVSDMLTRDSADGSL